VTARVDIKVWTDSATGAAQLVEHCTRSSWLAAAELRGILRMQYPLHAYTITIEERKGSE
jgi:hypothetical protein